MTPLRTLVWAKAFVLGLALSTVANGAETEGSRFVTEYIRGLSAVEQIRYRATRTTSPTVSQQMADCVRDMEAIDLEFGPAITRIKQFHFTGELQPLPGMIAEFYTQKQFLFQRMSSNCGAMMAGPKTGVDYGQMVAEAPKISARVDFIDKALMQAAPVIFAALISDKPDSQGHMSRLTISKAERVSLVRDIDLGFPNLAAKNANYAVNSAAIIKYYLTKKGYRCTDEP